jgi:hypothetical protein
MMIFASLRFMFALLCLCHIGWVQAEIYKSVDAEGHITYSSTPSKGAKKLGLESSPPPSYLSTPPPSDSPRQARAYDRPASPSDFPRVDRVTQRNRDSMRRKILGDELHAEEKLLNEARATLQQEKTAGSAGKMSPLQEEVTLHEKNIGALKTELSNLR